MICQICINNVDSANKVRENCLAAADNFRKVIHEDLLEADEENEIAEPEMSLQGELKVEEIELKWRCSTCGSGTNSMESLKKHYVSHRELQPAQELQESYKCQYCPLIFETRHQSHRHYVDNHKKKILKYQCDFCGLERKSLNLLRAHIVRKHLSTRSHLCSTCGQSFKTLNHLNRHELIHSSIRLPCNLCDKMLYTEYHLKLHIDTIHKKLYQ